MSIILLAEGESARAATVGWIVLALAGVALLLGAVVLTAVAGESLLDRLARAAPPRSAARWSLLVGGLALVAVGFIVASWGVAIVGAGAIFIFWRLVDRNAY